MLSIFLCLFVVIQTNADGTKQLYPDPGNRCMLDILNPNGSNFASYAASANERLQIHIQNPLTEKIYFGFGVRFVDVTGNIPSNSEIPVYYRIRDPLGNVVAGPTLLTDGGPGFIDSYQEAVAGPAAVVGATGYEAISFQPTIPGDYYIEFNPNNPTIFQEVQFKFEFFDISVANTLTNQLINGRLWSKVWDLTTLSFDNEYYSTFYVYTPDGVVSAVSYNGIKPWGFSFVANSTGTRNTGNTAEDRKSFRGKSIIPEFKVFLTPPDENIYPSGQPATLSAAPTVSGCTTSGFCINLDASRPTTAEVYLEFNGTAGFQTNSTDVLLSRNLPQGQTCMVWNGKNGLGQIVPPGTYTGNVRLLAGEVNLIMQDVENHPKGIIMQRYRPTTTKTVRLYFDDTNIPGGIANLTGCVSTTGCHSYTNNLGNENSMNSWFNWEDFSDDFTFVVKECASENTQIGVAKSVTKATLKANGSYNATYSIVVKNLGTTPLSNVQVTENLSLTFPAPAAFTLVAAPTTGGSLRINPAFNGISDINLLASGSTLAVGASQTITFTVNLEPVENFGPYLNSAIGTATSPTNTPTIDTSTNGNNPDPNGNGNPSDPGEDTPTPLLLESNPVIGIAKAVGRPVLQANGSFTVEYTFVVHNYGNVVLNNVQVTDNLTSTFQSPATFSVTSISATAPLIVNPSFNGSSNTNLLSAGSTLPIGSTQTITLALTVTPNSNAGPFLNTAIATGNSPDGKPTTDTSTNGNNPDPNGNNNPTDPDENEPTPLNPPSQNPVIGIAKAASIPALQANGSFNVTFTFIVANYGPVNLENVQVADNMAATFPVPTTFTITSPVTASGTLIPNTLYDGKRNSNLLKAGSTLAVGATATITLSVNVVPNGQFGTFYNTALATATGPNGNGNTRDESTKGLNPDPNGNSNPTDPGENVKTPIDIPKDPEPSEAPSIGIAKKADKAILQANGSYNVTFTFTVVNYGPLNLESIQVTDDLSRTFPIPVAFSMVGSPTTTGNLVANAGFNGISNVNMLDSNKSKLAVGERGTITFTLNIVPNQNFGPFLNTAVATATGPGGIGATRAESTDGLNPDPNGNNIPNEPTETTPTPIDLDANPIIGLAKAVAEPVLQNNGSFDLTYTFTVQNLGNTALSNVQILDTLTKTFPAPLTFTVTDVSASGTLVPNTNFNGNVIPFLLLPGSTLPVGKTETVTLHMNVVLNGKSGTFLNTGFAQATLPNGSGNTTDQSTNGTNPDLNNNGKPDDKDPDEQVATPVTLTSEEIFIPEGFSPNNDGKHDNFVIESFIERGLKAKVEIYNRWGNLVYKNNDYKNDWNGTSNNGVRIGDELPDGTYYFVIVFSNGDKKASYLTLKR